MIIAIIIQNCERDFSEDYLPSQMRVVYQSDGKPKPAAYQQSILSRSCVRDFSKVKWVEGKSDASSHWRKQAKGEEHKSTCVDQVDFE